jgi:esterase/lipase superfamily enzyme
MIAPQERRPVTLRLDPESPRMRFPASVLSSAARVAAAMLVALSVAGCLSDGLLTGSVGPTGSGGPGAKGATILVATTRAAADNGAAPWFGTKRGRGLTFAEARLEGPDGSFTGRMASVVTSDWSVAGVDKLQRDNATAAFANAALGRDVLLYVHGYRESFETAAASAAQLATGIGFRGATGLFSWPSGGGTLDYAYDRESALWSRDGLEDLLTALAHSPSGGRIHIVAHSMGSLLTLEALRMLRASGGEAAMARIGAVVLASPDVDIDFFTRSVERLGPDARKITVISSTNDRALELSRRIAGGVVRAGAADREKLEGLGVRVADASDYGGGLHVNHDLFLKSPDVQQVVKRAMERQ